MHQSMYRYVGTVVFISPRRVCSRAVEIMQIKTQALKLDSVVV